MSANFTDKHNILPSLGQNEKVIIELGCGQRKLVGGSIGIDQFDHEAVDIIANVAEGLSFLPDNSVDEIHSNHFLEHLSDLEFIFTEIHRVLKPGGKKIAVVPHHANPWYYSDYTHKSFFGLYTLCYLTGHQYYNREVPDFYNQLNFRINRQKIIFYSPWILRKLYKKIWQVIFNSSKFMQELYEENFCYWCPPHVISFEIEKV